MGQSSCVLAAIRWFVSTHSSMMSKTTSRAGRTEWTRPMIWPAGEPESSRERPA